MRSIAVSIVVLCAASAWADNKAAKPTEAKPAEAKPAEAMAAPTGAMDMSKMGPWSRKPTNESATKKEITEFFKQEEDLMKKGDLDAMMARMDFPVFMATDDAKGTTEAKEFSRDEYAKMMKPYFEHAPKDVKRTHKSTVSVLSDAMVVFVDDVTETMGKQKMSGRSSGMLVKKDGQWKWKAMMEPGWGGMNQGTGGSSTAGSK